MRPPLFFEAIGLFVSSPLSAKRAWKKRNQSQTTAYHHNILDEHHSASHCVAREKNP